MKNGVNKFTFINILSSVILQGITFVTLPIFTRLLGAEQFGIYSLFSSWVSIVTCVMGFSMTSALGPGKYTFEKDYIPFRNSNLFCTTIICLIQVLIIFTCSSLVKRIVLLEQIIVVLIGIAAFGRYIILYCQNALTFEKKAIPNLFFSIAYSLLSVVISIILISILKKNEGYLGRIIGATSGYIIVGFIFGLYIFKDGPITFRKRYNWYGIKLGTPIIFHSLSLNVLIQADRVMMQIYKLKSSLIGIYSLYYTLCSVLSIILTSLNNSWCPFYYDDIKDEKWEKVNQKCKNYIELFTVLCVGFLLLSREVSYLMADEAYWSGMNIIPFLAIAVYFTFMYQFPVNYELYHKKTAIIAIGTICAGILNICLNLVLIPLWGINGAALATAISYFFLFGAHFILVSHMDEKYHLKIYTFVPGIMGIGIGVFFFYFLDSLWYLRWFIGFSLGCVELCRIYKRKSIF